MKRKLLLVFFTLLFIEANAQQEIYNFSPDNTSPQFLEKFNGKIYFEGYDTNNGRALWKSDGTSENTFFFKDTHSRNDKISTLKSGSAILNNTLYYIASDETSAGELWKTNGTIDGTIKVTNFLNGKVTTLTVVGNVIYFIIAKGDGKTSIWKTDGTELGTVLVKEISLTWNDPSFEGKCSNLFMFSIQPAGTNNTRVWRSDGTSEGTFPITEELDGNGSGMVGGSGGSSILTQFIEYNNKLYFASRYFLFETDGTVENTKNVGTVRNPLLGGLVYYDDVIAVNNSLYLMFVTQKSFANTIGNISILRFDTLNKTIVSVYEKKIDKYFLASSLTRTGNSITFTTSNANGGTELVSLNLSDNVVSSIGELAGANDLEESPIALSINLVSMLKFNENQYFIRAGRDKINNRKGWIYDLDVKTLENISNLDNARLPFEFNNYLYYSKDGKLWKYSNNLSTIDVTQKKAIVFYPNPSSDLMQLNVDNSNEVENISVYDLNGKLLQTLSNSSQIDISSLSKGIYTAQIKWNGTLINKKIIKN